MGHVPFTDITEHSHCFKPDIHLKVNKNLGDIGDSRDETSNQAVASRDVISVSGLR